MNLTVNWLINDSGLNNFSCLAGSNNLNNKIESINILDNPDVLKWIKKNEFVLTTGYIFKDNEELQMSIIRELKKIGCSGLGIKVKRFFDTIPEKLIKEAEKLEFPLIEIPFFYSFSDISKITFNNLYSNELNTMELQNTIIDEISNCYFNGAGLYEMSKIVSNYINKTLLIVDSNYNLLSIYVTEKFNYLVNYSDEIILSNFSSSSYKNITDDFRENYKRFSINNEYFDFLILKLPNTSGALCVLIEDIVDDLSIKFLKKITNIVALEVKKNCVNPQSIYQYHNFFFDYLLSKEEMAQNELIKLCDFYNFNYLKKRISITLSLLSVATDYNKNKILKVIQSYCNQLFEHKEETFICVNESFLCIFIFFNNDIPNSTCYSITKNYVTSLDEKISSELNCRYIIGISRSYNSILSIRESFKESLDSISLNKALCSKGSIFSYNEDLIYHTLNKLPISELQKIYEDNILSLKEYNDLNNSNLIEILKMYYKCRFNSNETSQKLFIHRNTLLNKLDKIKSILNIDLINYNENISIYLGICAYELLNSHITT